MHIRIEKCIRSIKLITRIPVYEQNFVMYHEQQNKYYYYFISTIYLFAHNNITIRYYRQVNSLRLKSSVASKWAS